MQIMWLISLLLLCRMSYTPFASNVSDNVCDETLGITFTRCIDTVSQCAPHQLCSTRISDDNEWEALRDDEECDTANNCKCYCLDIASYASSTVAPLVTDTKSNGDVAVTPTAQAEIPPADSNSHNSTIDTVNGEGAGDVYLFPQAEDKSISEIKILIQNIWILIVTVVFVNILVLLTWCYCKRWTKKGHVKSHLYAPTELEDESVQDVSSNHSTGN
eukprot:UN00722